MALETRAVPANLVDVDGSTDAIAENAALYDLVGITLSVEPPPSGSVSYVLIDDAGGRFETDGTGEVYVIAPNLLNAEDGTYTIVAEAFDGVDTYTETFTISILEARDYGDAPDSYGTLLASDGPRHISRGPRLGFDRSVDADGQPGDAASADNDDGVSVVLNSNGTLTVSMVVRNANPGAFIDAWMDFNNDGIFGVGERIADSLPVVNGKNSFTVTLPDQMGTGAPYARFRISSAGGLDATGLALDGEVEDYRFTLDVVAPTVTIDQAGTQTDPANGTSMLFDAIGFEVVFSEPVTGFDSSDIVLGGTAGATTAVVSGSGTTYTVTVSGMTTSGTVTATIGAGAAVDRFGNLSAASTSTDNSVDYVFPSSVAKVIAVGAGPGGGPHVKLFDANSGDEAGNFFAYGQGFTGGVRVAQADVNGDGVADIITGAGPGGGPHVKVFDGDTNSELFSFLAFADSFTGGIFVAGGDLNGDNHAEIIVGAGVGDPIVRVYDGATGSELFNFAAYGAGFKGGVQVAAGDVDGDGKADIITGAGSGGGPHVKVFSGANLLELHSFFAYGDGFTGGVFVAVGDVNDDGKADILTTPGFGGGPHVRAFNGVDGSILRDFFAYEMTVTGGSRVSSVADVTGDSIADIVVSSATGGSSAKVFDGVSTLLVRSWVAFDPTFLGGVFVG